MEMKIWRRMMKVGNDSLLPAIISYASDDEV